MTRRQFHLVYGRCCYPAVFPVRAPFPFRSSSRRCSRPSHLGADPTAITWDGTGSWWTDANSNQSVIDRMVSRSIRGLTNQKTMPTRGAPSFTTTIALMAGAKPHIRPEEDRDQGESEQHNRPWHDRTPELIAHMILSLIRQSTGPGRVPSSSITIFDSSRFIPGKSLRQDPPRIFRRRICGPYRRRWTT